MQRTHFNIFRMTVLGCHDAMHYFCESFELKIYAYNCWCRLFGAFQQKFLKLKSIDQATLGTNLFDHWMAFETASIGQKLTSNRINYESNCCCIYLKTLHSCLSVKNTYSPSLFLIDDSTRSFSRTSNGLLFNGLKPIFSALETVFHFDLRLFCGSRPLFTQIKLTINYDLINVRLSNELLDLVNRRRRNHFLNLNIYSN